MHNAVVDLDLWEPGAAEPSARPALLDELRGWLDRPRAHRLLVGPAGSGRSCVLAQLGARVEADPSLSARLVIAPLGRGRPGLLRVSDLWVAVVVALAQKVPALAESARTLLETRDDDDGRGRLALDVLGGWSRLEGRRVLLLWDRMDEDLERLGWPLRAVRDALVGCPAVLVLGSAAAAPSGAGPVARSFADLFEVYALSPLDGAGQRAFYEALKPEGRGPDWARVSCMSALLGAWPAVVAAAAVCPDDGEAGGDLLLLLDRFADRARAALAALPTQSRAVAETLSEEGALTAAELAGRLGLDINAVSSQLSRLVRQGAVRSLRRPDSGRSAFLLADRALALWLMARRSPESRARLLALARLIAGFTALHDLKVLTPGDLIDAASALRAGRVDEAGALLSRALEELAAWPLAEQLAALLPLLALPGADALADRFDERGVALWPLRAALTLDRSGLHRLLPEAQGLVRALGERLGRHIDGVVEPEAELAERW